MNLVKEHILTFVLILLVVFSVGFYTYKVIEKSAYLKLSDTSAAKALSNKAEEASFTNMQGEETDLSAHVGKILIVNSWASWSPDSARELPMLADLVENYKEDDVRVVAINRGEAGLTAERFLNTIGVTGKVELILDPDDKFYRSIEGYSMPETVIYDRSGNIIFHARGISDMEILKENLAVVLGEE